MYGMGEWAKFLVNTHKHSYFRDKEDLQVCLGFKGREVAKAGEGRE